MPEIFTQMKRRGAAACLAVCLCLACFVSPVAAAEAAVEPQGITVDSSALEHVSVLVGSSVETMEEGAAFVVGQSFLWFVPEQGYELPEKLSVQLGERVFAVYTDGRVERHSGRVIRPAFSHESWSMDIPFILLEEVTSIVIYDGDVPPAVSPAVEQTEVKSEVLPAQAANEPK